MPRRPRTLNVWLHDDHVATVSGTRPGEAKLRYADNARELAPLGTPLLSCSLPIRSQLQDAYPFLTGLLPEGRHRAVMAGMAGVPTHDVIGMLARFGRDVAGAITLATAESRHRAGARVAPLDDAGLEDAVADIDDHPLGLYDDSELSLPGLQDKLLLVALPDGQWGRPVHGWPSTHLLKLDDRRRPGLVRAEHACLQLAAAAGLRAAHSELMTVAGIECLLVTRFDREPAPPGLDGTLRPAARLHQEDACQALGIDPDRNQGRAKYEQYGGPSLQRIAALLDAYAGPDELLELLEQVTFTVAIGNADAHGKNHGLLHPAPATVRLAPLYDTVPTIAWPKLRAQLALNIAGHVDLLRVGADDLVAEAARWGVATHVARAHVLDVLERLHSALGTAALPQDSPAVALVADRILGLLDQAR